jgi:hypothetical protein
MTRIFSVLLLTLFILIAHPSRVYSEEVQTEQQLTQLINRIEHQRFSWFGFQSNLTLRFKTEQGQSAHCQGNITYLRLEEKIRIDCRNDDGISVFLFQTHDVNFELFLPKQNKLYKGNIFDLDNNNDFHSHIKPFDIYRAIKPLPLEPSELSPGQIDNDLVSLYLWKDVHDIYYMHRKLRVEASSGNVLEEFFYTPDTEIEKSIYRSNFYAMRSPTNDPLYFPHTIKIEEKSGRETIFEFSDVHFLPSGVYQQWEIETRADTEIFTFPSIEAQLSRHTYFS